MPTYEYLCKKCKKQFEVWQNISEKPLQKHPDKNCNGKVERSIGGGSGFIFKGSGFYETDYRSSDYKKSSEKEINQKKESGGTEKKNRDKKQEKKLKKSEK